MAQFLQWGSLSFKIGRKLGYSANEMDNLKKRILLKWHGSCEFSGVTSKKIRGIKDYFKLSFYSYYFWNWVLRNFGFYYTGYKYMRTKYINKSPYTPEDIRQKSRLWKEIQAIKDYKARRY